MYGHVLDLDYDKEEEREEELCPCNEDNMDMMAQEEDLDGSVYEFLPSFPVSCIERMHKLVKYKIAAHIAL